MSWQVGGKGGEDGELIPFGEGVVGYVASSGRVLRLPEGDDPTGHKATRFADDTYVSIYLYVCVIVTMFAFARALG